MSDQLPGTEPITIHAQPGEITITIRDLPTWRILTSGWPFLGVVADRLLEARQTAWPD